MILMNSIATGQSAPRHLPVQWLEEAPMWTVFFGPGSASVGRSWGSARMSGRRGSAAPPQGLEGRTPALNGMSEGVRLAWAEGRRSRAIRGSATGPVAPVGVSPTGLRFKITRSLLSRSKTLMPSAGRRRLRAGTPALPGTEGNRNHHSRELQAFTLLEMMMVIAIIGFIAAMALPHVSGFAKANTLAAANRQILDDLAYARQIALVNRSTVYMVFDPPEFWTNTVYEQSSNYAVELGARSSGVKLNPAVQFNAMLGRQYTGYALIAMSTVGDQPGQHYAHYITDWRTLPQGVFISPFEFQSNLPPITISTTNTTTGVTNAVAVAPLNWSTPVPFPSLSAGTSNTLPFIGFSPQGSLVQQSNQYIVISRGSIFYPQTSNGVPIAAAPDAISTPVGNETNNPNVIQIDWLTSRATLLQNHM